MIYLFVFVFATFVHYRWGRYRLRANHQRVDMRTMTPADLKALYDGGGSLYVEMRRTRQVARSALFGAVVTLASWVIS